jgi:hypothetical protein
VFLAGLRQTKLQPCWPGVASHLPLSNVRLPSLVSQLNRIFFLCKFCSTHQVYTQVHLRYQNKRSSIYLVAFKSQCLLEGCFRLSQRYNILSYRRKTNWSPKNITFLFSFDQFYFYTVWIHLRKNMSTSLSKYFEQMSQLTLNGSRFLQLLR